MDLQGYKSERVGRGDLSEPATRKAQGALSVCRPHAAPPDLLYPVVPLKRDDFFESSSRFSLLVEHDLFRKPVSTFRDHALVAPRRVGARQRLGRQVGMRAAEIRCR